MPPKIFNKKAIGKLSFPIAKKKYERKPVYTKMNTFSYT